MKKLQGVVSRIKERLSDDEKGDTHLCMGILVLLIAAASTLIALLVRIKFHF